MKMIIQRQNNICNYFIKYEEVYVDVKSKFVPKHGNINICTSSHTDELRKEDAGLGNLEDDGENNSWLEKD